MSVLWVKKGQLPHPILAPSSPIVSANVAVENVISQRSQGSGSKKGIKYTVYSPFSHVSHAIVGK